MILIFAVIAQPEFEWSLFFLFIFHLFKFQHFFRFVIKSASWKVFTFFFFSIFWNFVEWMKRCSIFKKLWISNRALSIIVFAYVTTSKRCCRLFVQIAMFWLSGWYSSYVLSLWPFPVFFCMPQHHSSFCVLGLMLLWHKLHRGKYTVSSSECEPKHVSRPSNFKSHIIIYTR